MYVELLFDFERLAEFKVDGLHVRLCRVNSFAEALKQVLISVTRFEARRTAELLRLRMAQADEVIQFFFDGFNVVLAFHFVSEWVVDLFWFEFFEC